MTAGSLLSSVAVAGGDADAWFVGAMLAACLPARVSITLILGEQDAPDHPIVVPASHRLFDLLPINARHLVSTAGAAIGLGTDHIGWRGENSVFFAAPSGKLPTINSVDIHQVMLRAARLHHDTGRLDYLLEPFRFPALAAKAGKFAWPDPQSKSPAMLFGPQVQCSAHSFAEALRAKIPGGRIKVVRRDHERSEAAHADLTIDCSDQPAACNAPSRRFERAVFPFDRVASAARSGGPDQTRWNPSAKAIRGGVLIETPTLNRSFSEFLYASDQIDSENADRLIGPDRTVRRFTIETCDKPWVGNRIRLGRASAKLGPYCAADGLLLFEQISKLAEVLPAQTRMHREAATFNAAHRQACVQIMDRVLMPFVLNARTDPAWASMRHAARPESLGVRLDQFAASGRHARFEGELFDEQSWIDLQIGFGVVPQRCTAKALALDMGEMIPVLRRIANTFAAVIGDMPNHGPPFTG